MKEKHLQYKTKPRELAAKLIKLFGNDDTFTSLSIYYKIDGSLAPEQFLDKL